MLADNIDGIDVEPGIYNDITFDEYIRIDAINHSTLTRFMSESPFHFKYKMDNGLYKVTNALSEGRVIHEAVLEPDKFKEKYVEEPNDWREYKPIMSSYMKKYCKEKEEEAGEKGNGGMYFISKNSKAWKLIDKTFRKKCEDEGKKPISTNLLYKCRQIRKNLKDNTACQKLFEGSKFEITIVWIDEETGLKCKGRLDVNSNMEGYACDVKKTRSTKPFLFAKDVRKYHYNSQASFYMDGAVKVGHEEFKAFVWLACEDEDPFYIQPFYTRVNSDWITKGREWYRNAIEKLHYCKSTGDWHGYHDELNNDFDMYELPEMMY